VQTVHDAAKKAMDEKVFVDMARTRGYAIEYKGPDALKQELRDSYRKNEGLLKKRGLGKSSGPERPGLRPGGPVPPSRRRRRR
jgi:tripartite-type tricarboxylate transporter receptor subunit TctC